MLAEAPEVRYNTYMLQTNTNAKQNANLFAKSIAKVEKL